MPKIGIRPTNDGRLQGVRESLEKTTMSLTVTPCWCYGSETMDLEGADFRACKNFGSLYRKI